jgi:ABC-type molybdate transport system substrate-binding protein
VLQDVWEELKAALFIAYPNYEGLGEWEPAAMICNNDYIWENINTNQIDVSTSRFSISTPKTLPCGGPARSSFQKNL